MAGPTGSLSSKTVNEVVVRGSAVFLTLADGVDDGHEATVGYTAPGTNPLQDLAGNDVATISSVISLTNEGKGRPDAPPAFSSASVNAEGLLTLTGSPGLSIDMAPAHWGTKRAAYAGGGGTTSLTFSHTVVEPNYSSQGIAVLANSLALGGGTIRSAASQEDAVLAHSGLGHNANHKVDWRPVISVADAQATEGAGSMSFEVNLSRAFTNVDSGMRAMARRLGQRARATSGAGLDGAGPGMP